MFKLFKPTATQIEVFLKDRKADILSYSEVGATRKSSTPTGYNLDHNRQLLGHGRDDFEKAKDAIRNWKMFEVPGLRLIDPDTRIEPGRNVSLLAHHLGFWSLNSCRIVYVIDERDRFGFAY